LRDDLGADLRVLFYQRYALYDRPTGTEVIVIRVLHGMRDVQGLSDRGDLEES
jgi:plasmid stabilization system protein ParE